MSKIPNTKNTPHPKTLPAASQPLNQIQVSVPEYLELIIQSVDKFRGSLVLAKSGAVLDGQTIANQVKKIAELDVQLAALQKAANRRK